MVAKKQPRGHHYGSTIPRDLETYLRAQTSYRLTRGQKSTLYSRARGDLNFDQTCS